MGSSTSDNCPECNRLKTNSWAKKGLPPERARTAGSSAGGSSATRSHSLSRAPSCAASKGANLSTRCRGRPGERGETRTSRRPTAGVPKSVTLVPKSVTLERATRPQGGAEAAPASWSVSGGGMSSFAIAGSRAEWVTSGLRARITRTLVGVEERSEVSRPQEEGCMRCESSIRIRTGPRTCSRSCSSRVSSACVASALSSGVIANVTADSGSSSGKMDLSNGRRARASASASRDISLTPR
mmetsp:Transcript_2263/g.7409  ORF Transcript_2263/g.7409 Transcript_2263/m.7409 type:complete len:241 (-) Transcript_2263:854-1576(-)